MPVTASTATEIFVGAGDVYVDDQVVGATMDDNVFRIVRESGSPKFNGVPGPLKGVDYIDSETAELEVSIPQISDIALGYSIPGVISAVGDAIGVSAAGLTTTLAADSAVGATNIKCTAVAGAIVGDVLQIGAAGAREFRTVTVAGTLGAGGTGLDLDAPLTKAHLTGDAVVEIVATTLAAPSAVGAVNVRLTAVTGLAVGDYLRVGFPGEQEVRKLTFVGTAGAGGTGASFLVPLGKQHRTLDTALEQTSEGSTLMTSGAGLTRRIPSSAYHKWELRIPGLDGREVRFRILAGLMTEQPEFTGTDASDSPLAPRLTIQARWDPAASTVSPWEIERIGPTV